MRHALEEAETGRGGVVAVTGEAGIGKTRLPQEVAEAAAARGCAVHAGRCWEEGGAPAYWPWIQVVRSAGGDFTEIAAASSRALPDQADPEGLRFGLFDAVTRFLLDRADQKAQLVVLEDLHAADEASLLLLRFLGRRSRMRRLRCCARIATASRAFASSRPSLPVFCGSGDGSRFAA